MSRAVYLRKGPAGSLAGWAALAAVVGAVLWSLWQGCRIANRYRGATAASVAAVVVWAKLDTHPTLVLSTLAVLALTGWWLWRPASYARWVSQPYSLVARRGWYRRRWQSTMLGVRLANEHTEHHVLTHSRQVTAPRVWRMRCGSWIDRLMVRPLVGQTVEQWAKSCDALAMALGALECRVVAERAGFVRLDVVWSDPLATPVPALPVNIGVDLTAVPVGVRENRAAWTLRLLGNHLLVAGVTGAGKSSVLWSIVRAIAPAIHAGTVQLWGIDPKGGMEFRPARPLFTRFADGTLEEIAKMLEDLVAVLDARADRYADAGVRTHAPTTDEPLIVLIVDELAFLTAYCPDRKMRDRINLALATLLSKGRGPGVCVIGALQDPRKEVIGYRNLFPTKIALRLDEKSQVDMVLGDGARDAGARCDRIPEATPGIAYVKDDGVREPVRVRAGYVTDDDIAATAATFPAPVPLALRSVS